MEEIVILDEQKRLHPIDDLRQVLSLEELRQMQSGITEIYVDQTVAEYIVRLVTATREHPDVYLGSSPRARSTSTRSGRRWRPSRAATTSSPMRSAAGGRRAGPWLIIKTQASLREIDPDTSCARSSARGGRRRRHAPQDPV